MPTIAGQGNKPIMRLLTFNVRGVTMKFPE